jgi:hypothetical protein
MGQAFARVINLQLEQFSPEEAKRRHIAVARRGLAAFMARQSSRPGVVLEVDGHPATTEDEVQPYGVIVYHFTRIREIALVRASSSNRTLTGARAVATRSSWFVMVNDQRVARIRSPRGPKSSSPMTSPMREKSMSAPRASSLRAAGYRREGAPDGHPRISATSSTSRSSSLHWRAATS